MQEPADWHKGAGVFLPLLLFCLIARGSVPAGWMPAFEQRGIAFVPCAGFVESSGQPDARGAHSGHHVAGAHNQSDKSAHDTGGQPCAFAAAAIHLPAVPDPVGLSAPERDPAPFAKLLEVSIRQGLAAPPPPSTGPPATA